MEEDRIFEQKYNVAVQTIKTAILQSQNQAIKLINREQLALYYGIGRYISSNSRNLFWGTGTIDVISNRLRQELPGLRGFSPSNLKNMRTFYEEWQMLETNSPIATGELESPPNEFFEIRQLQLPNFKNFPAESFFTVGFTHHCAILSHAKTLEERYYYIQLSANECLKVETLKKLMRDDVFHNQSTLPNNFISKLPSADFARRAILAFKDEYLLDFINVEELGARDIEDVDECVIENKIVQNIKSFIMTFGKDFTFVGNQYRVEALGHTHIIDLLFFNRELSSLVAIDLLCCAQHNSSYVA